MGINLQKGQVINLTKSEGGIGISQAVLGLGWQGVGGRDLDLDSYVALLDSAGNTISFVYFSNLRGPGVKHFGDDLVGGGRKDDPNEQIAIDFDALPDNCEKVIAGLFIYSGASNLSQVDYAFATIHGDGKEQVRFKVSDFKDSSSLVVGEFVKRAGEWNFRALGNGERASFSDVRNRHRDTVSPQGGHNINPQPQQSSGGFWSRLFG
jgi:tellurium resistance protein TerD